MLRGVNIFCADPNAQFLALRRVLALFLLPMALFVAATLWQQRSTPVLQPPAELALWLEPLPAGQSGASTPTQGTPDNARWHSLQTPYTAAAWASPGPASHYRAWLRIRLSPDLQERSAREGRAGILLNRVFASGPWSAWAQGQLLQTNQRDWSIQWNTPLSVLLPVGASELYLALPVQADQGFALGSLHTGLAADIALAHHDRTLWMTDLPRAATIIALLLAAMTLPVALRHRSHPVYTLFCANALVWSVTNLAYFHDYSGNPGFSSWFGLAMDLSVNWNVVLSLLFALEFMPQRHPRLAGFLVAYAALSTLGAIAATLLNRYDLFINHYANILVFSASALVYLRDWAKAPTREATVLLFTLLATLITGLHSLLFVSSMARPDHVYSFPMAVLASFFAFLYVLSRRWAAAIRTAQLHQAELQEQLTAQKEQLQQQHEHIATLELTQQLHKQRQAMLQDLHDGLGSNLITALEQARTSTLPPDDAVLLLEELSQDLRQLSAAPSSVGLTVSDLLAQLRGRIDRPLARSALQLQWDVAPRLPKLQQLPEGAGVHLRAILNEAIANVLKHAYATELRVHASVVGALLHISVSDNGTGQRHPGRPPSPSGGMGLSGMHSRARAMGWTLHATTRPAPATGFAVTVQIPLAQ